MINTLLTYDLEELDEFIVSDYTSKKVDIYNLFQEMKDNGTLADFLEVYRISDDDKLERISYSIYGTPDYWDILLQINDRNPLFQMPYNLDTTFEIAEAMWVGTKCGEDARDVSALQGVRNLYAEESETEVPQFPET